jgi:hypothetical protein
MSYTVQHDNELDQHKYSTTEGEESELPKIMV